MPYRIVLKIQKKWDRYGDPGSWRRECDLYASDLGATFSDAFRWPTCYHAAINAEENEFQLWLEYIDGVIECFNLAILKLQRAALTLPAPRLPNTEHSFRSGLGRD